MRSPLMINVNHELSFAILPIPDRTPLSQRLFPLSFVLGGGDCYGTDGILKIYISLGSGEGSVNLEYLSRSQRRPNG